MNLTKRWRVAAAGAVVLAAGGAGVVVWGGSSISSGLLGCPNDYRVFGHGMPNPASIPRELPADQAVLIGLEELHTGITRVAVEATDDPRVFLVKTLDGANVEAIAHVVPEGDGWRLDSWETCGYRTDIPDPGPGRLVPSFTTTSTAPGSPTTADTPQRMGL